MACCAAGLRHAGGVSWPPRRGRLPRQGRHRRRAPRFDGMPGALSPDEASVGVLWLATLSVGTRQPTAKPLATRDRREPASRASAVAPTSWPGWQGIRASPDSQSRARHDLQPVPALTNPRRRRPNVLGRQKAPGERGGRHDAVFGTVLATATPEAAGICGDARMPGGRACRRRGHEKEIRRLL